MVWFGMVWYSMVYYNIAYGLAQHGIAFIAACYGEFGMAKYGTRIHVEASYS